MDTFLPDVFTYEGLNKSPALKVKGEALKLSQIIQT